MNTKRIVRIIALVMAILLFLGLVITPALAAEADSSSIGVIGGADGPTAIFISRSSGSAFSGLLPIFLIAGAGVPWLF